MAKIRCDHCFNSGVVLMKDKDDYKYSLACTCANGNLWANNGNARWNGENIQVSKLRGVLKLITY